MGGLLWSRYTVLNALILLAIASAAAGWFLSPLAYWPLALLAPSSWRCLPSTSAGGLMAWDRTW